MRRGAVKLIGPNSQLLPKICFGGSPKKQDEKNDSILYI